MNEKQTLIHKRAVRVSQVFNQSEKELISILQDVEHEKVHLVLNYTSVFAYTIEELKLAEHVALNLINVSRKSVEIPELKEALLTSDMTLAKARRITSVLTPQNKDHWIGLAKSLTQRSLEREVAKVMPETLIFEKSKYVSEKRILLQLGVSEDLMEKLKLVQNLLSQKTKKASTIEEALNAMTEVYLERNDPIKRAKRSQTRETKRLQKSQVSKWQPASQGIQTSKGIHIPEGIQIPEGPQASQGQVLQVPQSLQELELGTCPGQSHQKMNNFIMFDIFLTNKSKEALNVQKNRDKQFRKTSDMLSAC